MTNRTVFLTALQKIGANAVKEGNKIIVSGKNIQLVNLNIRSEKSEVNPFNYGFSPDLENGKIVCMPLLNR